RSRRRCRRATALPTTGEHCPALAATAVTAATAAPVATAATAAPAATADPGVARCSSRAVLVSPSRPSSFVSGTLVGVVRVVVVRVALEWVVRELLVVARCSCSVVRARLFRPSSFVSGTLRVEGR
ncbi:unnamed protein product, partial [Closterium sp. NIES-54]